ncbi:hypothetical protein PIB30_111745, partial [Stylosanthes scabra]|nr:hypothetical protein [Stylosanthes scabra]
MDSSEALPPPPPAIPANFVPEKAHEAGKEESQPKFLPMVRSSVGTKGRNIQLE